MIEGFINESIVKRAREKDLVDIELIDLRKYAINDYGSVDDRPYGGGAGMVLRIEPIYEALQYAKNNKSQITNNKSISNIKYKKTIQKVVLTSPKGKLFTQKKAIQYSKLDHLIIITGHYEGVDERIREYVNEEVSLGDFVMTGGEITASAITDSVARLIPGVLKKESATKLESFFEVSPLQLIEVAGKKKVLIDLQKKGVKKVKLLEYPQYTRPTEFKEKKIPEILLSGNHKEIEKWRLQQAYIQTLKNRKDLLV